MRTYTVVLADSTKIEVRADDVDLSFIENGDETEFDASTAWFNFTNNDSNATIAAVPYKEVKYIVS